MATTPSSKRRAPHVGETVLLRADLTVRLPLMVTRVEAVSGGHAVWGTVFTEPELHNDTTWIRENRFWKPTAEQPNFLVSKIPQGRGLGEWEFADARAD